MEVKWIKIVTNIFDDEKIKYIETLPNGDETIVIWFRILCLAGKSNSGGLLMMTDRIAYTEEMLASIFQRDIMSIRLALKIFEDLEMIERFDNKIYLTNWEKHQNIESLEKIRLDTKKRVAKHRERQKSIDVTQCNVTVTQNVTQSNAIELEEELEIDIDKEKDIRIKNRANKFAKPTLEEIKSYCVERKNTVNPQKFIDHYTSNGWMVGRNKMKDWKASVRTWEKSNYNQPQSKVIGIPSYYTEKDDESEKQELLRKLKEM